MERQVLLRGQSIPDETVISFLQQMLAKLPLDNINIRPHREDIQQLVTTWPRLDESTVQHLSQTIAPLLRYYWASSLPEIQFRIIVERIAIAHLSGDKVEILQLAERAQESVRSLADNINEVKAVAEQRAWVLSDGFWSHLDQERLDMLQNIFAPLMRFRQRKDHEIIKLNLPDQIASRRWIIYGPSGEGAFSESYREQVEACVRRLVDDVPALGKLKRGETIAEEDIEQIAKALNQADLFVTEDILREVYQQPAASLPDFMLHILDIAKLPTWEDNIKEAFDNFIADHGFMSASQINFLRAVRAAVLRHSKLTRDQLHLPPLSRIGVAENLFNDNELNQIIDFANNLVEEAA